MKENYIKWLIRKFKTISQEKAKIWANNFVNRINEEMKAIEF